MSFDFLSLKSFVVRHNQVVDIYNTMMRIEAQLSGLPIPKPHHKKKVQSKFTLYYHAPDNLQVTRPHQQQSIMSYIKQGVGATSVVKYDKGKAASNGVLLVFYTAASTRLPDIEVDLVMNEFSAFAGSKFLCVCRLNQQNRRDVIPINLSTRSSILNWRNRGILYAEYTVEYTLQGGILPPLTKWSDVNTSSIRHMIEDIKRMRPPIVPSSSSVAAAAAAASSSAASSSERVKHDPAITLMRRKFMTAYNYMNDNLETRVGEWAKDDLLTAFCAMLNVSASGKPVWILNSQLVALLKQQWQNWETIGFGGSDGFDECVAYPNEWDKFNADQKKKIIRLAKTEEIPASTTTVFLVNNVGGAHWNVYVLDVPTNLAVRYDSFDSGSPSPAPGVMEFLRPLLIASNIDTTKRSDAVVLKQPKGPQQEDATECGIFAISTIESLIFDAPRMEDITTKNMGELRKELKGKADAMYAKLSETMEKKPIENLFMDDANSDVMIISSKRNIQN